MFPRKTHVKTSGANLQIHMVVITRDIDGRYLYDLKYRYFDSL